MRRLLLFRVCLSLSLLLVCASLLAACGGGGGERSPFEEDFPVPTPPPGGGGGNSTPPPAPPQTPLWNANAAAYGRTALFGAFPSDLVRHDGTLFAVDADAVESTGARILPYDVSGPSPTASGKYLPTTIRDTDLVDSAGNPGDHTNPIGFGYFLNDILLVNDTLGFVLVNAGGSDSSPALSNLVAFNPTTGVLVQTLPLTQIHVAPTPIFDSTGMPVAGNRFLQSGAEGMAWIPTSDTAGRLFVAMSNLIFSAPSFGAVKFPGTVQVLDVDTTRAAPVAHLPGGGGQPRTIRTRAYNPVALAVIHLPPPPLGALPIRRLLVTCAGTTGYDAMFNLVPVTPAAVEAYDATTDALDGAFALGLVGLSAIRPAIGTDAAGHRVGFYPSSVTGEIYLLRLDGLFRIPVDPAALAVLRGPLNGIPIAAAQAGGPGGNITGVGLSPDGRTLAVSGFGDLFAVPQAPGKLFLLNLPADVVTGAGFGTNFVPGSTEFGAAPGRTLGNLVLVPGDGSAPDVYVNVSGTLDENFLGSGGASLGSLQTFGLIR